MEYYRTIGQEEYDKLINGETIVPINDWSKASNTFPKDIKGIYLYNRDDVLENSFYNYMGGDYIVLLDIPDDRIIARGIGTYSTNISDEDGWYGTFDVNESMISEYTIKDVTRIIDIKKDCYYCDDWFYLNER
jgi:hypothetical protein